RPRMPQPALLIRALRARSRAPSAPGLEAPKIRSRIRSLSDTLRRFPSYTLSRGACLGGEGLPCWSWRALRQRRYAASLPGQDERMIGTQRQKGSCAMRSRRSLLSLLALLFLIGVIGLCAPAQVAQASTGSWTPTDSMHMARYLYTATLLQNGQVLVAG